MPGTGLANAQRSLDLEQGVLLRAVLVEGPEAEQRLLLVIHHLAVDGAFVARAAGRSAHSVSPTGCAAAAATAGQTSASRAWAARLQAYAGSDSLRQELSLWQQQLSGPQVELPCDRPQGARQNCHARTVSVRLDAERTRQLLQQAPSAYRTQVNDLLLTALARVLCHWTGQPSALVQLEGHGRETLFDEIDLSRTVGWFTSAYPLRLTPRAEGQGASIKAIKEQLRTVPHKGLGMACCVT